MILRHILRRRESHGLCPLSLQSAFDGIDSQNVPLGGFAAQRRPVRFDGAKRMGLFPAGHGKNPQADDAGDSGGAAGASGDPVLPAEPGPLRAAEPLSALLRRQALAAASPNGGSGRSRPGGQPGQKDRPPLLAPRRVFSVSDRSGALFPGRGMVKWNGFMPSFC